jgi:hypothetical protein
VAAGKRRQEAASAARAVAPAGQGVGQNRR